MPRRVHIVDRILIVKSVTIPRHRLVKVQHDTVRREPHADSRIIPPRADFVQSGVGIVDGAGVEAVGDAEGDGVGKNSPISVVARASDDLLVLVRDLGQAAGVVVVQKRERPGLERPGLRNLFGCDRDAAGSSRRQE